MKKIIFRILPALMLLITAVMVWSGCEKKENKNPLKNTEWKLVHFVDAANNAKKTPDPDSEKCYVLRFLE
ncbi:hypothetical protein HW49_08340, partial [Porphyromonadaceae bacterium COT-184 OH4590]